MDAVVGGRGLCPVHEMLTQSRLGRLNLPKRDRDDPDKSDTLHCRPEAPLEQAAGREGQVAARIPLSSGW